MPKTNKESPTRRRAKQILGELSCFIYRSDAHYDRENYENDLDIIEELIKGQKRGKNKMARHTKILMIGLVAILVIGVIVYFRQSKANSAMSPAEGPKAKEPAELEAVTTSDPNKDSQEYKEATQESYPLESRPVTEREREEREREEREREQIEREEIEQIKAEVKAKICGSKPPPPLCSDQHQNNP